MDQLMIKQRMEELKQEQEKLAERAASIREDAIREINEYIAVLNIRPCEITFPQQGECAAAEEPAAPVEVKKAAKRKVAPKYVTPDGATFWTGRGKMPVKFRQLVDAGTPLESMLIEKPAG